METSVNPFIPDHVPLELVREPRFQTLVGGATCPFAAARALQDEGPLFWNPEHRNFGGAWMVTRAADIRYVTSHPELFSNKGEAGFSKLLGEDWDLVPLEIDPPMHGEFRRAFNHLIAPPAVERVSDDVRRRAIGLIEGFKPNGGCEFMDSFGFPFPVGVFLSVMGFPESEMPTFLAWGHGLLNGATIAERVDAARAIKDYLVTLAAERRARPIGDIVSQVVHARISSRALTDEEVLGALYLIFIAGIDTVASTLSFAFKHLAENPDHRRQLIANPKKIPRAIEEYMRRFSTVTSARQAVEDVELHGQRIKAGDWISVTYAMGSLDPAEFADPMTVDYDRAANRHFGFAYGPHFCMGSHLARREMNIAFEEWLTRIPDFELATPDTGRARPGAVFGTGPLELVW
jgi:cytochrome P450